MTTDETYTGWRTIQSPRTREMIRIAARQMGDLVRSTLGPLGLDKMVVRRMEDDELRTFVSNDGIAILEEFEGETDHPIANYFIELAEAHEDDYGDGTTTTVLLASELLSRGMDLADRGIHPHDAVEGFSIGAQRTLEVWEEAAIPLAGPDGDLDRDRLRAIAMTGMTNGRAGSWPLGGVADEVVEAVLRVSEPASGTARLDRANTVAAPGGSVADTTVVDGAVVADEPAMAEHLLPATGSILLVRGDLESRSPSTDLNVAVENRSDAGRTAEGLDDSEAIAEAVGATGAVAVLVTGDADWAIGEELARHGAVLLRNVQDWHFEYVAHATGATPRGPVTPGTEVDPAKLGRATVRYRHVGPDDEWMEFRAADGVEAGAVALLVRGGTTAAAEEAERRVRDGQNALRAAIRTPLALPAGGAADLRAAAAVRELAPEFDGREQLAVEAFADVLDVVPKTLARNAGRDPLEALTDLRARHDAGHVRAAVDTEGDLVDDVTAYGGGLDAFQVRTSALVRAVEFANDLLRIDSLLVDDREADLDRVLDQPEHGGGALPF